MEERKLRKAYRTVLERSGMDQSALLSDQLVEIGYTGSKDELGDLARLPRFSAIVDAAYRISSIIRSNLVVRMAADKAAQVVLALKTYSRQGHKEACSSADIRSQLETVLTILRNPMKNGVEIVRRFAEVPPVVCHPDRLNQVWMNLISNAIHAMNYRGRLELVLESVGDGESVAVSVIDDGPGIPDSIRPHIFEPFFTTKKEGEGTGLGLAICRRILDEIGATIEFESRPGRTRFTAILQVMEQKSE